eukprot:365234-Chlamydomonas_euryale.AAC.6
MALPQECSRSVNVGVECQACQQAGSLCVSVECQACQGAAEVRFRGTSLVSAVAAVLSSGGVDVGKVSLGSHKRSRTSPCPCGRDRGGLRVQGWHVLGLSTRAHRSSQLQSAASKQQQAAAPPASTSSIQQPASSSKQQHHQPQQAAFSSRHAAASSSTTGLNKQQTAAGSSRQAAASSSTTSLNKQQSAAAWQQSARSVSSMAAGSNMRAQGCNQHASRRIKSGWHLRKCRSLVKRYLATQNIVVPQTASIRVHPSPSEPIRVQEVLVNLYERSLAKPGQISDNGQ